MAVTRSKRAASSAVDRVEFADPPARRRSEAAEKRRSIVLLIGDMRGQINLLGDICACVTSAAAALEERGAAGYDGQSNAPRRKLVAAGGQAA